MGGLTDSRKLSFLVLIYFMGATLLMWIVSSKPGWEKIGLGGSFLLIIQALIWVCLRERLIEEASV